MSGEPDSGIGSGGSGIIVVDPSKINSNNNNNNNNNNVINNNNNNSSINNNNKLIKNNNDDTTDCELDKITTANVNYDSNDAKILLKCDRCDKFETISRALLLVHIAQCNGGVGGNSSRRQDESDPDQQQQQNVSSDSTKQEQQPHQQQQQQQQQQQSQSQQHLRKLFECDVCNMKFSNGANMRRHKMRHTGVKPYECRVCQKRFFRKDHLAEHFTTHTKTLPYHCPICNRGFQRQIAMRAHFQNEHVGQHDLVKTCPLCSFRAGTMKSLRVHFFNRHGIDLDNPGPNASSSLLLALDTQNAVNYLSSIPSIAGTASAGTTLTVSVAGGSSSGGGGSGNGNSIGGIGGVPSTAYSDSGDSLRSGDNATPPMHFLTPHVEISMADNDSFKSDSTPTIVTSAALEIKPCPPSSVLNRPNASSPSSQHSADSNSNNVPSSSQSLIGNVLQNSRHLLVDGHITPSISLIPIKQEPPCDEYHETMKLPPLQPIEITPPSVSITVTNSTDSLATSSNLTNLIKVSPLKSLLREDLKRRISARANNRAARNNSSNNNNNNNNSNNNNNNYSTSTSSPPNSITVTTETIPIVVTTSNGIITSTGPETELLSNHQRKRMLQCLFCGIEFPDQTLYFLHKGCHSESNPWKCNICGEQCNNVYEFNSHLLSKSHQ